MSNSSPPVDYKAIARLFVEAEIRLHGRCRSTSTLLLQSWVNGQPINPIRGFLSRKTLEYWRAPALYIECYEAMAEDVKSQQPRGRCSRELVN